ncbi:hypothetical protein ACTQ49_02725 [Luteococcus sp. Sow4_B9]|uniref:hypothetical protein n=1 Tax=Luteococcus sp. Sow4_B9 TaxID=3438792 RepID=UPI003F9DB6BB
MTDPFTGKKDPFDTTNASLNRANTDRSRSRAWAVICGFAGVYLVALGGLLAFFGQHDDSPGLGGLGLINAIIGIGVLARTAGVGRSNDPQ